MIQTINYIKNKIKNYVEYEKLLNSLRCTSKDNKKIFKCIKKAKRKDRQDLIIVANSMVIGGYNIQSILNHINYLIKGK